MRYKLFGILVCLWFLGAQMSCWADDQAKTNGQNQATAPTAVTPAASPAAPTADDWNPNTAGPITTWTAPVETKGKFYIQPFSYYAITRGNFDSKGNYHSLPAGDAATGFEEQVKLTYGLTDKIELDAQPNYQVNYARQDGKRAQDEGFGDSLLDARYQIFDDKGWVPTFTGMLQLKVPTGKYQHLDPNKLGTDYTGAVTGGGSWDPGFGLNATKKLNPFIVHGDIIYSMPQDVRVDGDKTQYGNYLNADAAVEYILPKGFNLMTEINGLVQSGSRQVTEDVSYNDVKSLTWGSGIGWSNDKIQTIIAYQRVLVGTNTAATDSIVGMFVYNF